MGAVSASDGMKQHRDTAAQRDPSAYNAPPVTWSLFSQSPFSGSAWCLSVYLGAPVNCALCGAPVNCAHCGAPAVKYNLNRFFLTIWLDC